MGSISWMITVLYVLSLTIFFAKDAHIFPIKAGKMYIEANPLGLKGKSSQGESLYTADNPPVGAVFTYLLNDTLKTAKQLRQAAEAKAIKAGKDVAYPSYAEFKKEDTEGKPYLVFTIMDEQKISYVNYVLRLKMVSIEWCGIFD